MRLAVALSTPSEAAFANDGRTHSCAAISCERASKRLHSANIGCNCAVFFANPLKGALGDALHAVMCGAGHNIRLLLKKLRILCAKVAAGWLAWLAAFDAAPADEMPVPALWGHWSGRAT